jgi:hypothetical protein
MPNGLEIPPSSTRDELRNFARQEFERNRRVDDVVSGYPNHPDQVAEVGPGGGSLADM